MFPRRLSNDARYAEKDYLENNAVHDVCLPLVGYRQMTTCCAGVIILTG
jgi:hypothetical protein